jgi:hypothetical protein
MKSDAICMRRGETCRRLESKASLPTLNDEQTDAKQISLPTFKDEQADAIQISIAFTGSHQGLDQDLTAVPQKELTVRAAKESADPASGQGAK